MIGDEDRVVRAFRAWLEKEGWEVEQQVTFCDVVASRGDERLYAEAKGRTSSPGLDVDTLYGQLLRRIPSDGLDHRLGVVVPTEAISAALRVPSAVRERLGITIYEVTVSGDVAVVSAAS